MVNRVSKPPISLLLVALACIAIGTVTSASTSLTFHWIGYATASFISLSALTWYWRLVNRLMGDAYYRPRPLLGWGARALAVVSLVVAGMNIWDIAYRMAT